MSLSDYIQRKGNAAAAALFGVSEGTAKAWRYGYRKPSTDAAQRIIALTGGAIGWDEIYAQARTGHSTKSG
jgi:DNA-binding transcriptional regulator YdaS (Cro superfamily)